MKQAIILSTLPPDYVEKRPVDLTNCQLAEDVVFTYHGAAHLRRKYFLHFRDLAQQHLAVGMQTLMHGEFREIISRISAATQDLSEFVSAIRRSDSYSYIWPDRGLSEAGKKVHSTEMEKWRHWLTRLQPSFSQLFRSTPITGIRNGEEVQLKLYDLDFKETFKALLEGALECVRQYPAAEILSEEAFQYLRLPLILWRQEEAANRPIPMLPSVALINAHFWRDRYERACHTDRLGRATQAYNSAVMSIYLPSLCSHFVLQRSWDPELYMEIRQLAEPHRRGTKILTTGKFSLNMTEAFQCAKYLAPDSLRQLDTHFPVDVNPWRGQMSSNPIHYTFPKWSPTSTSGPRPEAFFHNNKRIMTSEITAMTKPRAGTEFSATEHLQYCAWRYLVAQQRAAASNNALELVIAQKKFATHQEAYEYLDKLGVQGEYIWKDIDVSQPPQQVTTAAATADAPAGSDSQPAASASSSAGLAEGGELGLPAVPANIGGVGIVITSADAQQVAAAINEEVADEDMDQSGTPGRGSAATDAAAAQ
eukprot:GHVU01045975.1.p1 GENE.GHVU01045975.1~~GHVU01045975.1.p1  ORF type:complete len:535 (-),score=53.45 GHVU01045975.1:250-1854(-)